MYIDVGAPFTGEKLEKLIFSTKKLEFIDFKV